VPPASTSHAAQLGALIGITSRINIAANTNSLSAAP
jgi:hypothetical protein